MIASKNPVHFELSFDIGHSSIGWAVLGLKPNQPLPAILGCGVVTFEKDGALANQRRLHRSQRRHIRATRLRIARIEKLLTHLGVLTAEQLASKHLASGGHSAPWLLAARVLASKGERILTWTELWDVLRWYAHNRGYEEIGTDVTEEEAEDDDKKDAEKVANAKTAMADFGKTSMAETICAWLELDPLGDQIASRENYKTKNCAFEREVVINEVRQILLAHRGKLPKLDDGFIHTLLDDARSTIVPAIKFPQRYRGSLLFGRLETRYHNRIIGRCPISGKKIPNKNSPEFLRFRWAMQLSNIRIGSETTGELRPLSAEERKILHTAITASGYFGVKALKDSVRSLPGATRDNLETLLLHPDAKESFIYDPARKLVKSDSRLSTVWEHLPEQIQKRTIGRWRAGKQTSLATLRAESLTLGHDMSAFDAAVEDLVTLSSKKGHGKSAPATHDEILSAPLDMRRDLSRLSGRAPYARPVLIKAFEEVMAGIDPKGKGGCLEETDGIRKRREARPLTEQTNNHLVRHRLLILSRLLKDILADKNYVAGQVAHVERVTIEVNRDLREMSGLTAQDIAKELGARLSNHKKVSARLEKELPPGTAINASLIRKARIADDLGWRCPYTGIDFEPIDLIEKRVDKDHIIPRSQRPTDSLDSLVLTFAAINKWKGKRTAWQFIEDCGGKTVPDAPNQSIMPMNRYKEFVAKLDTKGHDDDYKRKKRRKEYLLVEHYEEKAAGFTPGHLTQTSQLARLAAQVVREPFSNLEEKPKIVALPGSVTGSVRRSWDLLGCLAAAAPDVMDSNNTVKTKTEIREITHLHHALDACVIGLASMLFPNNGDTWRLLSERRLGAEEQKHLAENLPSKLLDFDTNGGFRLRDLAEEFKQQIRVRLTERRVVQHIPSDMNGLRVEENTRGILKRDNGRVFLRQRKRDADGNMVINESDEPETKVIGLLPLGQTNGKLAKLNGVRVIADNFGVAILDDTTLRPEHRSIIIPFANVWQRMTQLRELNGGRHPLVLRNGEIIDIPEGKRIGRWRIFSIKNNASGMALDLGSVEAIRPTWINCLLKSLLRDKARRLNITLTGADK